MNFKMDIKKRIQNYWENSNTISIIDKNLHKIEIDTVCRHLLPTDYLADIGCGSGEAIAKYAKKVYKCIGIEKSNYFRKKASELISKNNLTNVEIKKGDILDLDIKNKLNVIITQRLLINLSNWEDQKESILLIHKALKPYGRYIMIENTNECFTNLNNMRKNVNLEPIPLHWHNFFFDRQKMLNFMKERFKLVKEYDFSLYYFLTRVYTQMFASFKGYGKSAVKDNIFEKSDESARIIYELFKDNVKINPKISTIQCFVWERR